MTRFKKETIGTSTGAGVGGFGGWLICKGMGVVAGGGKGAALGPIGAVVGALGGDRIAIAIDDKAKSKAKELNNCRKNNNELKYYH